MPSRKTVEAFAALVEAGDYVGAIEQFYASDASTRENSSEPVVGRDTLMAKERGVMAAFRKIEASRLGPSLIDGDTVAARWKFTFTGADGSHRVLEEIAWQTWRASSWSRNASSTIRSRWPADASKQPGADEQRAQRVGCLHRQHRVPGGALKRTDGIGVQRLELDPFDRTEIGDEPIGLADGRDRHRLAVQIDLENCPQRRAGIGYVVGSRRHDGDVERRDADNPSFRLGTTTRRLIWPFM
jgi:hypothetical protein